MNRLNHVFLTALIALGAAGRAVIAQTDVLLVPDSDADRIMAFDPSDGSLINADFITDPGKVDTVDVFDRPIKVIDSGRGTLLISDQFADSVVEFSFDGAFLGVFSNGGVIDTELLNNVRGLVLRPNGSVFVCNNGGQNDDTANSLVQLDNAGVIIDTPIFTRYGGLDGPFDALVTKDRMLVTSDGRRHVAQYDLDGKFTGRFVNDLNPGVIQLPFPQQISQAANGNILIAVFSAGFIAEYDSDGNLVQTLDNATLTGYRGVHELDNGQLMVTTSSGVHVIDRADGSLVQTVIAADARFITRITLPDALGSVAGSASASDDTAPTRRATQTTPDAGDERGAGS